MSLPRADAHAPNEPTPRSSPGRVVPFGHATVLIELDGTRLLTDPVLACRVGLLRRLVPVVPATLHDGVDAILISHLHADHADLRSLRRLAGARCVAPPGAGRWLRRRLGDRVTEISVGGSLRIGGVTVLATDAAHGRGRWPLVGPRSDAIGFLVEGSRRIYFAGDTDLFDGMARLGPVDLALLPVAGWGPTLGPGHLDADRAAEAVLRIGAATAVPIHYGTLRPLWIPGRAARSDDEPAREFAEHVARRAPSVSVHVLAPGQELTL